MLTTDEFILRYETYTDADLHAIYGHLDDYSPEAREAFGIVIQKKGGLEKWLESVEDIITLAIGHASAQKDDLKIKPRTIIGSLLGVLVATLIGGIGWGLNLIYAPDMFIKIELVLLIGLMLLCYAIVKKFTRQSKKNIVVFIATALSVILSILLGMLISDLARAPH